MLRITPLLFLLFLALSAAAQQPRTSTSPKPTPTPQKDGSLPSITKIRIDKNQIMNPCPAGYKSGVKDECPSDSGRSVINVQVLTSAMVPNDARFEYEVTGGTINGEGPKVEWDVRDLDPGTYTLTGRIATQTQRSDPKDISIMVMRCPQCNLFCDCPIIKITAPDKSVKAGESVIFAAGAEKGSIEGLTYNWSISEGEIASGQGTGTIEVRTFPEMAGKKVTATLEIGGSNPACSCPSTQTVESQPLLGNKPDQPKK